MLGTPKSELHKLVDALPQEETMIARRFLEFLLAKADDPVLRAFLDAPEDDEPVTEEDLRDIEEGRKAVAEGRVKSWEQVKEELGL
ncbi:MAG: hypothetical protein ABSF90_21610 [Syntrophobacteraceae bacterium]